MIKAIIFDADGVIINSFRAAFSATAKSLK